MTIHPTAILNYEPLRGYTSRDPGEWPETRIGARVAVGVYAIVYRGCIIGDDVLIGDGVKIREGVSIADRVRLHWDVTVNYGATIGAGTTIGTGCHITGGMFIGARCFFGAGVMTANDPDPRLPYDFDRLAPPIVANDVLIGAGAILLPGCRIGDGATIGAGAIVDGEVPAGATVVAPRGRRVGLVAMAGETYHVPNLGSCSRCGAALDNVSPGFSVVKGGAKVCTPCLQPGEEVLRARSLTGAGGL